MDLEERIKVWQECHAILHEDQPYTFLTRSKLRIWLDDRIHNVERMPALGLNYVSTWPTQLEWYVPKDEQVRGKGN